MANAGGIRYALLVDGVHFRQGMKSPPRKLRAAEKALLAFDGSFLTVEAWDRSFAAQATGLWPGIAKVSATFVAALAKAPLPGAQLRLGYSDGSLRLGALSMACAWQPVSGALLELPAAPDWIEAISLKYRAHRSRIAAAGLDKDVRLRKLKGSASRSA